MSLFCPKCGSIVEDGAMFCEKCGQSMNAQAPVGQGGPAQGTYGQPRPGYTAAPGTQGGPAQPAGYGQAQGTQQTGFYGAPGAQGIHAQPGYGQTPGAQGRPMQQGYGQAQGTQGRPMQPGYGQAPGMQYGAQQPGYGQMNPYGAAPTKKPFNKKLLIPIIGGPILVAAIVILLVVFLGKGSGYSFYKQQFATYYDNDDDSYFLVGTDGKFVKPREGVKWTVTTADGKMMFFATKDGEVYKYDGTTTRIDSGREVHSILPSFDGSAALYYIDDEVKYWNASGTTTLLPDIDEVDCMCISPDGGSAGLTVTEDSRDTSDQDTYLYDGKELIKQGKGVRIVSVSNGLKRVYLISEKTQKLYRQNGTDESTKEPMCSSSDSNMVIFNNDLSSALVCDYHGDCKLFVDGGDEIRLRGFVQAPVNTLDTQGRDYQGLYFLNQRGGMSYVFNCSTFKDFYFTSDSGEIYKIDSNYELQKVTSRSDSSNTIVEDQGLVYFRNNYYELEVASFDSSTGSYDTRTLSDDDVESFWILGKNRAIVKESAGSGAELHLKEVSGDRVNDTFLGECDNNSYRSAAFLGGTLYYVLDGDLYSTSGDKGVRNRQFESVTSVESLVNGVLVVTVGDGSDREVYSSVNGTDFTRVY